MHLIGINVTGFDELDEARTGGARQLELGRDAGRGALVRAGTDRPHGAHHTDAAASSCARGGAYAGLDHADNRNVEPVGELVERRRRRAVAGDDKQLDRPFDEDIGDLAGILQDFVGRLWPVREAAGVTEVHDVFGGQQIEQRAHDREAAQPTVEDADRTFVPAHLQVHATPLRLVVGDL